MVRRRAGQRCAPKVVLDEGVAAVLFAVAEW
jgi:hypothetical protein